MLFECASCLAGIGAMLTLVIVEICIGLIIFYMIGLMLLSHHFEGSMPDLDISSL